MWCKKKWLNLLYIKPKKLEHDLQDKKSVIKYTEKTSVEGFSAVKLRAILKSKDIDKKVDDDDDFDDNDHNDDWTLKDLIWWSGGGGGGSGWS